MPTTVRSPVEKRKNPSNLPGTPASAAGLSTGHEGSSETSRGNTVAPQSLRMKQTSSEKTGEVLGSGGSKAEEVGETPGSSARDSGMVKPVGKLDNEAYRPWGANSNSNPNSRANSDVGSDTATET